MRILQISPISTGSGLPLRESAVSVFSHCLSGDEVTLGVECIVDRRVGGYETLSLSLRLEALHFSLPSSDGKVTVLGPIVVSQSTGLVAGEGTQFAKRRSVRRETIRHDGFGDEALVLEQFSQQFQRCLLVPSLLHEDVENLSLLVDCPPHKHSLAADLHDHLIQVPDAIGASAPVTNTGSDGRPKLVGPAPNRLITEIDPALGEQIFDIPQAQSEAIIEPDCIPNYIRRKAVSLEGYGLHPGTPKRLHAARGDLLALD